MEQHNQEIGTRRDLVLYRLETVRNDLKSARAKKPGGRCVLALSVSPWSKKQLDRINFTKRHRTTTWFCAFFCAY